MLYNFQTLDNRARFCPVAVSNSAFSSAESFSRSNRRPSISWMASVSMPTRNALRTALSCFLLFCLKKYLLVSKRSISCIKHNIRSEIKHTTQAGVNQGSDPYGDRSLEIPDMGTGRFAQLNMLPYTLLPNTGFVISTPAAVADNTFITIFFIFTTMTFPVFLRLGRFLAKTIPLRL